MAVTFSTPSNGTVMSASTITGLLDDAFEFVNGGVGRNDVTGELSSRHLLKPEFRGFPTEGMVGQLQDVGSRHVLGDTHTMYRKRNRQDIFLAGIPSEGWVKVPGAEWSGYVPNGAHVDITCEWSADAVHNEVSSGNVYPAVAGYFVIGYRDRSTDTVSFIAHTRREIHVPELSGVETVRRIFSTYGYKTIGVSGGRVYDFFLAYNADTAVSSINQIVVGRSNLLVEVLKDG